MTHTPKKREAQLKHKIIPPPSISRKKQLAIKSDMTKAHGLYENALTKRAVFKTSNTDLGDDLVQTTFLKTLLYLQKGGQIDTMRAFLNRILNDLIVDEYRKRKTVSLDTLLENGFEPSTDDYERHIDILDGQKVILLIDQLPKKYQRVMRMKYVQGLSLKEMSILTNQTQNTISVQSYRGLKKLKILEANCHKK